MNNIGTQTGFCYHTAGMWQFAGQVVLVLKILIPAILIIIGVIALGKAVIADDDKEVKSAVNKLIKKFIVAVCIFFIPTVVTALFSVVTGFSDVKSDYEVCVKCITSPNGDSCKGTISDSTN